MKLLHVADLHLGRKLLDFDLYEDQKHILNEIVNIAVERQVDGILVAGDVYDKQTPSERATMLLDDFITDLSNRNIETYMISGNHDSDARLNFGGRMFADRGIHIASIYNGTLESVSIADEFGEMNIYLMPFVKASQVKHFYPEDGIEDYSDALRTVIDHADIDENKRNIIVAHQYVIGAADPELAGSEGRMSNNVGTVEKVNYDVFDKFDYVALGHIHSAQRVGRDEVRYAGTPLKYSLSEAENNKTVTLVTFGHKGDIDIERIDLHPLRDLRHITDSLENICNPANVTDEDDFIYATLTNAEPVENAINIVRQYYPNAVRVNYAIDNVEVTGDVDFENIVEDRSFGELIADFYKVMYGDDAELSEEEVALLTQAAEEAGVIDETN